MRGAREVAVSAISIALVAVATMGFTIYIPETKGYFNLGEAMIYIVAFLFGPRVGALAGGIGSMISDLVLGFPIYAPATLVIKGFEGFVVGYLSQLRVGDRWKTFLAAALLAVTGISAFLVFTNFYTGLTMASVFQASLTFRIHPAYWVAVILGFLAIYVYMSRRGPAPSLQLLSALIGGAEMVLGYLAYESFLFGVPAAMVEVPFNVGQVLAGCIISIPIYGVISRSGVLGGMG